MLCYLTHITVSGITHSSLTSSSRSRIEYLIPSDNILLHVRRFNLTNKSNIIGRL